MVSSRFTIASLLAASSLASAGASQDLHALFARQQPGTTGACLSETTSGCEGGSATTSSCRAAACSAACLDYLPGLSDCCSSTGTLIQLTQCIVDLVENANYDTSSLFAPTSTRAPSSRTSSGAVATGITSSSTLSTAAGGGGITVTSSTSSPATTAAPSGTVVVSVATNSAGQPTATFTSTRTGGADHVAAVGQLGVVGSALAWALSLLLL